MKGAARCSPDCYVQVLEIEPSQGGRQMGQSLSNMELCKSVENAFLPLRCTCSIPDGRFMTIQILAEGSDIVEFTVVGIDIGGLHGEQQIAQLVTDIVADYRLAKAGDGLSVDYHPLA
jgi:hypothetical protein